jgi:hypothetical protein
MNLLGYTAPDQRANAALHIAPHVMIYRHFVRDVPRSARSRRSRPKRLKLYAASCTFRIPNPRGIEIGTRLSLVVAISTPAATRAAKQHLKAAIPADAFNHFYVVCEASEGLLATVGEEVA